MSVPLCCPDRRVGARRITSSGLLTVLLALSWLLLTAAKGGEDPVLVDLDSSVAGHELQASLHLLDAFDERTRERIESGLPTTFTYVFKLETRRRWWFDPTRVSSKLQVVAMYNAIQREYLINYKLDGRLVESRVVKDFRELERAMTVIGPMSVLAIDGRLRLDLGEMREGRSVLRAKAVVGSRTLLGFIPATVDSGWAEIEVPVDQLSLPPDAQPPRPSLFQ